MTTQGALAAALGVDKSTVSRWESGGGVDPMMLEQIEDALGLDRGSLGTPGGGVDELVIDLRNFSDAARGRILGYIDALRGLS